MPQNVLSLGTSLKVHKVTYARIVNATKQFPALWPAYFYVKLHIIYIQHTESVKRMKTYLILFDFFSGVLPSLL